MKVLFVSGIAPIVADPPTGQRLFSTDLGLHLTADPDYPSTDELSGVKHFGVWSLTGAAQACFGTDAWPTDRPRPQATVEFEVDDVDAAAAELLAAGHDLISPVKTEPWGQRLARLQTADGLLIAVTHTPWMRGSP
ncbi:MAG: glyoxalase [Kineosporiaceae bacterium]|nr:glyoxalase [Kineosporiaceae bacterium]MBK7625404.1 glyoxalase [Kineosporiaceae bacterium]MBK8076233.1 glyoxalase [Kineosporiaceae bacterium]